MASERREWLGGYVREGKKAPTYVIERWIRGVKFHVSTRCHTERAALKQLESFEADPWAYKADGQAHRNPVVMTDTLVLAYRDWMIAEKGNTKHWSNDVARHLFRWMEDLKGKDLRTVNMQRDLKPALARRKTSRKHRVEAIKGFYGWMRKEQGLLTNGEDPTLDLPVPVSAPAKYKRKRVVESERILAVMPHLPEEVRDVLHLQTGTAWHISEVRRFAIGGTITPAGKGPLGPLATLTTMHKKGKRHNTPASVLALVNVATRIRSRGAILSDHTLNDHMTRACKAAGVAKFCLGVMRHTTLTLAVEMGASVGEVSEFAGHESKETTRNFYLDVSVPTVSVPVLRVVR